MIIAKVLASIGALTIAGLCGVFLGWLEKKAEEERNRKWQK